MRDAQLKSGLKKRTILGFNESLEGLKGGWKARQQP